MTEKFWQKFTIAISVSKLLFIGLNSSVLAEEVPRISTIGQLEYDKIIPLIASSETSELEQKARLERSLAIIDEMEDSQHKVILLNDLALSYAQLGNQEKASSILGQSLAIAQGFEDIVLKVSTMSNIAKYYAQIAQQTKAIEILENTVEIVSELEDKSQQGQLLLEISLKYGEMGEEESAQRLFTQSQTIIAEASQPLPEFPFKETPTTLKIGFSGSVNSFRDTTGFFGVNLDYTKQWSERDIFVDGSIAFDFDSSRSENTFRPQTSIASVYRKHFNAKWNFFTDFFNRTNQDLYSSKNDDEDLTIITGIYAGAGLNLWRGDTPSNFLDFQLGIGPRYEYDYIDFELRRNQIDPVLAIIFLGRGFSLGEAKMNQTFAIVPALNNFNNYILQSDTKLSIPLSERWSFNNRLFARYRNELIFEDNPKVEFFFSTGLEYEF